MKALTTLSEARTANARADQWIKADERWCEKMAQSAHVMTAAPPTSPSRELQASAGGGKAGEGVSRCRPSGEAAGREREALTSDGAALEEEEREEDKDLGPDAGRVVDRAAERVKGREDDEHERPGVVEREGQVDEELVGQAAAVVGPDDVVDGRDERRDEERQDKRRDVPAVDLGPRRRAGEQAEQGKAPLDPEGRRRQGKGGQPGVRRKPTLRKGTHLSTMTSLPFSKNW